MSWWTTSDGTAWSAAESAQGYGQSRPPELTPREILEESIWRILQWQGGGHKLVAILRVIDEYQAALAGDKEGDDGQ